MSSFIFKNYSEEGDRKTKVLKTSLQLQTDHNTIAFIITDHA